MHTPIQAHTAYNMQGQLVLKTQEWNSDCPWMNLGSGVHRGTICLVHLPGYLWCCLWNRMCPACGSKMTPQSTQSTAGLMESSPSCLDFVLSVSQKIRIADYRRENSALHRHECRYWAAADCTWLMDESLGWIPLGHFTTEFSYQWDKYFKLYDPQGTSGPKTPLFIIFGYCTLVKYISRSSQPCCLTLDTSNCIVHTFILCHGAIIMQCSEQCPLVTAWLTNCITFIQIPGKKMFDNWAD